MPIPWPYTYLRFPAPLAYVIHICPPKGQCLKQQVPGISCFVFPMSNPRNAGYPLDAFDATNLLVLLFHTLHVSENVDSCRIQAVLSSNTLFPPWSRAQTEVEDLKFVDCV
jgi:hypothetical protein